MNILKPVSLFLMPILGSFIGGCNKTCDVSEINKDIASVSAVKTEDGYRVYKIKRDFNVSIIGGESDEEFSSKIVDAMNVVKNASSVNFKLSNEDPSADVPFIQFYFINKTSGKKLKEKFNNKYFDGHDYIVDAAIEHGCASYVSTNDISGEINASLVVIDKSKKKSDIINCINKESLISSGLFHIREVENCIKSNDIANNVYVIKLIGGFYKVREGIFSDIDAYQSYIHDLLL